MTFLNLESISDQVRRLLQREIEGGKLTPGTRIREESLAKELGISKSPIRLALHQLKQDGIVRIEPRRGFYVAVPSPEQVLELLEMREVLDGLAARLAASRENRDFIAELESCFSGFKEETLGDRINEYFVADRRFQRLLTAASGSAELRRTLEIIILRLHMSMLYEQVLASRDIVGSHRQHMTIIDAIKAGDAVGAETAASSHARSVRRMAAKNIESGKFSQTEIVNSTQPLRSIALETDKVERKERVL